jgi:DNA polymerase-3 subunit gamma/tau
MAYQVIARKYRPQRFSDVVGQEHVTRTLAHAIEQNRIAHAYLFCGPRGTGKTTIARIFSKCLNATGGPKVDFADDDPRCQEIAEGRSLDVLEIDAASNRGIDEIRGLRETVRYAPASSKFKIYIIDEVHMLTKEAFNALLKTLEEPPEHVKFMFATTEPEKVLVTILSRCQRFDLRRIPAALIVKHLEFIANQEKVTVDEAAKYAIARGAEGAMRDAESTLDQLISFCGNTIAEADVLSMFGLTAQAQLLGVAQAVLEGNTEQTLRLLNELSQNGKDLSRLLSDLLNHFRNLLIFQISRGDRTMLEISETEAAALAKQAAMSTPAGITRILEVFGDAESKLRDAASKKTLIEVSLLRAIESRNAVSIDSLLQKLTDLRSGGTPASGSATASAAPTSPARPKASAAAPAAHRPALITESPAAVAKPEAPAMLMETAPKSDATNLTSMWDQVLEAVGKQSLFTKSYLQEAHPLSVSGQVLTIGFPPEFQEHISLVDNPKNQAMLQSTLAQLGFPGLQIKFVKSAAVPARKQEPPRVAAPSAPHPEPATARPAPPATTAKAAPAKATPDPKPTPPKVSKEDFKNDPLIRAALEMFRGQIVEVRN